MFKLKLSKFKKAGKYLQKLPEFLAKKSFLTFLGLFFIFVLSGLAIFYYFFIFLIKSPVEIIKEENLLRPDIKNQQSVLEEWQRRNENFQAADFKEYPDFFN